MMQLFDEVYGAYYTAVARILEESLRAPLTRARMKEICDKEAFAESFLTILPALETGEWQLIKDGVPLLHHPPVLPPTRLQLCWLKAICADKRFRLFCDAPPLAEDPSLPPLWTEEDYFAFDKYADGDNYGDEQYINNFRALLRAIGEKKQTFIEYRMRDGSYHWLRCSPYALEYSEKDDKFRACVSGIRKIRYLNLARMRKVTVTEREAAPPREQPAREQLVFSLTDRRNALERALTHFAHFEKEVERTGDGEYSVRLYYDEEDETEVLIRVRSFGPMIRVLAPEKFLNQLKERLNRQKSCGIR